MIAIPVTDKADNPAIDTRFGRASYFCLVSPEGEMECIENGSVDASSGAGTQTVQMLAQKNTKTVITPEVGPKAMQAMRQLGIEVFHKGDAVNVQEVLESHRKQELKSLSAIKPGSGLRRA